MTDKQLLDALSQKDRKKMLSRWWDKLLIVVGAIGVLLFLLLIFATEPAERTSDVIIAVTVMVLVPSLVLLYFGLRKNVFWSKEKQDAYLRRRLAKQAFKEQSSQYNEPIGTAEVAVEPLQKEVASEVIPVVSESDPLADADEPAPIELVEAAPVIEKAEDEPEEIILFPEA